MSLHINTLLEWQTENLTEINRNVERILFIESLDGIVVTINIFSQTANPQIRYYKDIKAAIDNQSIRVLVIDPYAHMQKPENEIQEKHRKKRDCLWELISELVESEGINPYISSVSGTLISAISARTGKSRKDIYKYRRRYWQSGKIKNALLPLYKNSGARGKRRLGNQKTQPKLGKPSNKSQREGSNTGIRITEEIERKFQRGLNRFYEARNKRKSLKEAFQRSLETFFHIGYDVKDGVPIPILPSSEELPNFRQFRYWYEKIHLDPIKSIIKRLGERSFNLKSRELLGDATSMAFGPGSMYQIDATVGDIYLVSELDRTKIIGRPVIYVVIDVFSRMIVGVTVLLEGPSWYGAMLALDNVVEDKVSYCAKFGITIQPEEWAVSALPEIILADRGEFEGYSVESLINNFRIIVQNTAPYRGDWKSIVERHFGIATEKFIKFSPGGVIKDKVRGDRDYRLDAIYTLHEFETLVVAHILNYNQAHELKYYRKDKYLIADEVKRFPIDIWNWGMENRTGHLQTYPRDIVRLNLLPRKEVSVTAQGIHFSHQLYYTCDTASREGWFVRARDRGSWKISVAYHPHSTKHIYLLLSDGKEVEFCELTLACRETFKESDFYSTDNYFHEETIASEDSRDRQIRSNAEFNARHNHITKQATKEKQLAQYDAGKQSKKAQIEGIRENRAEARDQEREKNIWKPGEAEPENDPSLITEELQINPENSKAKEQYVPAHDYTARLSEIRRQQQNNRKNNKKGE